MSSAVETEQGATAFGFATLHSGMIEMTRPSLYGAQHPISVIQRFGRWARQKSRFDSWVKLGKRKGLAALASANPSLSMVAGAGFEPATFGS